MWGPSIEPWQFFEACLLHFRKKLLFCKESTAKRRAFVRLLAPIEGFVLRMSLLKIFENSGEISYLYRSILFIFLKQLNRSAFISDFILQGEDLKRTLLTRPFSGSVSKGVTNNL